MPSLARSVPKPLKVPSLARSVLAAYFIVLGKIKKKKKKKEKRKIKRKKEK